MSLNEFANQKQPSENDVREAIKHYAGRSNDELMAELVKQIAKKREQGEMQSVRDTIERIKPFLDAEKKKRLEIITGQLDI